MAKLEIEGEAIDGIIRAELKQTMAYLRKTIKEQKKLKGITEYQAADLGRNITTLASMEEVYDYYGGNLR